MLTIIIPVKNEQDFLPTCLKSAQFADEILVLDSGSTDDSLKIAKKFGAKIHKYQWKGYKYSHELGAKKATGDWLFYLDADERISKNLRIQIEITLKNPKSNAYRMPRKNYLMGKFLRHGGWYPDTVTRLIKKDSLKQWIGELHEYPEVKGKIGKLSGEIYHLSHRGLKWMLLKTISYTQKNAQLRFEAGHPPVKVKNFFGAMIREFFYRAVKKSGWRDGLVGWLEIIYQTFNAFLIQVFIWELQQKKSWQKKYQKIDQKISKEIS